MNIVVSDEDGNSSSVKQIVKSSDRGKLLFQQLMLLLIMELNLEQVVLTQKQRTMILKLVS